MPFIEDSNNRLGLGLSPMHVHLSELIRKMYTYIFKIHVLFYFQVVATISIKIHVFTYSPFFVSSRSNNVLQEGLKSYGYGNM